MPFTGSTYTYVTLKCNGTKSWSDTSWLCVYIAVCMLNFFNALSTSATDLYLHFMMFACIPQVNDSECNLLELSPIAGYTVRGYAVFDGPTLTGRITFVR